MIFFFTLQPLHWGYSESDWCNVLQLVASKTYQATRLLVGRVSPSRNRSSSLEPLRTLIAQTFPRFNNNHKRGACGSVSLLLLSTGYWTQCSDERIAVRPYSSVRNRSTMPLEFRDPSRGNAYVSWHSRALPDFHHRRWGAFSLGREWQRRLIPVKVFLDLRHSLSLKEGLNLKYRQTMKYRCS